MNCLWKIYQLSFTLSRPIISYPNQIYRSIQDNYGNLFRQAILLKFVWKIYQLSFTLRVLSKTNHGSISTDPPTKIASYPNHWDQIWIHLYVRTNSLTVKRFLNDLIVINVENIDFPFIDHVFHNILSWSIVCVFRQSPCIHL